MLALGSVENSRRRQMKRDSDIDRLLAEEGELWRRSLPTTFTIDEGRLGTAEGRMWTRRGAVGLASVAVTGTAVVALVAVIASPVFDPGKPLLPAAGPGATSSPAKVPTTSHTVDPSPAGSAEPDESDMDVVNPGDQVEAAGYLGSQLGQRYLCPTKLMAIQGGLGCLGADLVPVTGAASGVADGQYAQVQGKWDGEAIEATSVIASAAPPFVIGYTMPCKAPAGGWPAIPDSEEAEAAARALEREVAEHPDRYVGLWPAPITDAAGRITARAVVVGTLEDEQSVAAELARIYPFNLCVIRSDFSASQLQPVLDRLLALDRRWQVMIEPAVGRVVVTTTVLDSSTAAVIAEFADRVDLRVTVRKMTPGP
jgi:hypothetical protein